MPACGWVQFGRRRYQKMDYIFQSSLPCNTHSRIPGAAKITFDGSRTLIYRSCSILGDNEIELVIRFRAWHSQPIHLVSVSSVDVSLTYVVTSWPRTVHVLCDAANGLFFFWCVCSCLCNLIVLPLPPSSSRRSCKGDTQPCRKTVAYCGQVVAQLLYSAIFLIY